MNIKRGFTLAEVLLALGIVGVISALTMPTLINRTAKAEIGPSLSKFVNTFENAAEAYLYKTNATLLSDSFTDIATSVLDNFSDSMVMTKTNSKISYKSMNGKVDGTDCQLSVYKMKNGAMICSETGDTANSGGAYKGIKANILVDINGGSSPNRAGVDVFKFFLDDTGVLIPYGSEAMTKIYSSGKSATACSNNATDIPSSFSCTGKYADNGWKS